MSQKTGDLAKRRFKATPFDALISVYADEEKSQDGCMTLSVSSICRIFQKNILFAKEWPKSIEK